jgi:hypothetical protein
MRSRGITPLIFNLGTRWWQVVNFSLRPLYKWEIKSVPLEWELNGPRAGPIFWWREKSLCPAGIWTPNSTTRGLVTIPPALLRLLVSAYIVTDFLNILLYCVSQNSLCLVITGRPHQSPCSLTLWVPLYVSWYPLPDIRSAGLKLVPLARLVGNAKGWLSSRQMLYTVLLWIIPSI